MSLTPNKTHELLETLSDRELVHGLTQARAQDVLSIVFDAINSTIGGIIITDLQGAITFANLSFCKMFEYQPDHVIGKNAAGLFASKEVRSFSDVMAIVNITEADTQEFVVERSDGTNFVVEVSASHVTSRSGEVIGRMASFVDISERKRIEQDREELIKKLRHALDKIKTLRGIIPICAACKKIRDDEGYWHQVEKYVRDHSEAEFSHSICPDCVRVLYPAA